MHAKNLFEINIENDTKIVEPLSRVSNQSVSQVKHAMSCGAVWLDRKGQRKRIRRAGFKAQAGDLVSYHFDGNLLTLKPPIIKLIATFVDFSVWHKPAGMTVSGSRYCDHLSLKRCVESQHPDQPNVYIVHRLDQYTQGLIIVAHRKKAASALSSMFKEHTINKRYHAVVDGLIDKSTRIDKDIDGKHALSTIEPVSRDSNKSLIEVTIYTGRKHQIRRHLAGIDHPVIGDRLHGAAANMTSQPNDLQLAATHLSFKLDEKEFEFNLSLDDINLILN